MTQEIVISYFDKPVAAFGADSMNLGPDSFKHAQRTKLRILNEAIQSNLEGVRVRKIKTHARPKRILFRWLSVFFIVAGCAYLFFPSFIVSPAKNVRSNAAGIDTAEASSSIEESTVMPAVSVDAPRPINRAVLPLSITRIVIDAGHGGKEHGAISDSGVSEKDITLDVALRLSRLMEKTPFEVILTRETDQTIPLEQRVAFANSNNADLFVSIHVNWMEPREIRPLETYYVGASNDSAVLKLASAENRDSGYSLSEYRRLLDKIYLDTRRDESRLLAKTINAELYQALSQINPRLENRGVKMAPFAVLVGTQMPAVLAEVSCLSNEDDVKLLTNSDYREKIAEALLRGIRSYANNLNSNKGS